MGYGFKALNGSSEIIIDQDYVCPRLFAHGTKSFGINQYVTYAARSTPPLVAVAPRTGQDLYLGLGHVILSGATYTGVQFFQFIASGGPYTCDYALFDEVGGISSGGNSGMQVFNASGSVAYDSRDAYMEVVDVISVPAPGVGTVATTTYSHTSLADAYYVVSSLTGIVIIPSGGIGMILTRGIRQTSRTACAIAHGPIGLASGADVGIDTRVATSIMVCKKVLI